jgi:hypothetical protein
MMIGSMSPDFAYFLPGEPVRIATHTIPGLFVFCWPVGLVLWLLFVRVLEQPTLALMPESWAARIVPPHRDWTFKRLLVASAAVILGALTHLIWDSFTHANTPVTSTLNGLHSAAFEVDGAGYPWYAVLQHVSTVIGLVFLTVWAVGRLRIPPAPDPPRHYLPTVSNRVRAAAVAFLLVTSCAYAIARYMAYPHLPVEHRLFHFAIGGMTAFALAWLAVAIWISARSRS